MLSICKNSENIFPEEPTTANKTRQTSAQTVVTIEHTGWGKSKFVVVCMENNTIFKNNN